jgi:hypothetical protein
MQSFEIDPDSIELDTLDELAHALRTGPVRIGDIELPAPLHHALRFIIQHLRAGNGVALRHIVKP